MWRINFLHPASAWGGRAREITGTSRLRTWLSKGINMSQRTFKQFVYTLHDFPALVDCQFTVNSAVAGGISDLVGPGVADVFMAGDAVSGEPDPNAGFIVIKLDDPYNGLYNCLASIDSPNGAEVSISASTMTAGNPYVISVLGSTTDAQWEAIGVPASVDPAVGVPFIVNATFGSGTGEVKAASVSGIDSIEVVGLPDLSLKASGDGIPVTGNVGSYLVLQCLKSAVVTAPANGSRIRVLLYLNNTIDGNGSAYGVV